MNDYVKSGPLTEFYKAPDTVLTPRVLKDGADSVGALGALNRVFINIGLFSEDWLTHFNPLIGGKPITPITIKQSRKNSSYWQANEAQTPDLALFFIAGACLAGLAPLTGFFAKFVVIKAGFDAHQYVVVAASLVASFLNVVLDDEDLAVRILAPATGAATGATADVVSAGDVVVSFSLFIPLFAEPLYRVGRDAAAQLTDQRLYVEAVMGSSNVRVEPAGAHDGKEAH